MTVPSCTRSAFSTDPPPRPRSATRAGAAHHGARPSELEWAHPRIALFGLHDRIAPGASLLPACKESLRVGDDGTRDVRAARAFDPFESRRAVDLEDLRAILSLKHVDARDLEAHDLRSSVGRLPILLGKIHAYTEATA